MSRALPLVAAAVFGACAHRQAPPAAAPQAAAPAAPAALAPAALASAQSSPVGAPSGPLAPPPSAASSPSTAPVVAQWRVKSRGKGFLELVARVERRDLLREVLKVHVQLPPEMAVESGEIDYSLPPAQAPGADERVLRLKYTSFPEEPLVLSVDAEGDTFTLHATSDYRFGRSKLRDASRAAKVGEESSAKPKVAAP
jgi:hypothetical protein